MEKKSCQFIALGLFICLYGFLDVNAQKADYLQQIEQLVDSIVQAEDIPALSVGIIGRGKDLNFINRGYFDRTKAKAVNEHSLYQIASLSKMFAGIITHQLIMDGKIRLDQPITDFFPSNVSGKTRKKFEGVTFLKVLHHRADLPRNARVGYKRIDGDPYKYEYTEADLLQELAQLKRKGKGNFAYSNFGYSLLGYLLEQASGKAYEELLTMYVFEPYKLSETTYTLPKGNPNLVTPYRKENRDIRTEGWYMGKLSPATTICSNTHDLLSLMKAQLKAYREIENGESLNRLVLTEHTKEAFKGIGDYGFGLFKWASGDFGHGGDVDGFASDYSFSPNENFGVTVLTSSGGRWVSSLIVSANKILKKAHAE